MELKGSKTEKNLMAAFAGESQAHTKYEYYASKAKKDGFVQISKIFEETSHNEAEHAKIWFKLLHNNGVPDTLTNLNDAANGENYEWTDMYAHFAADARAEGFEQIAFLFEEVGKIEKEHEREYQKQRLRKTSENHAQSGRTQNVHYAHGLDNARHFSRASHSYPRDDLFYGRRKPRNGRSGGDVYERLAGDRLGGRKRHEHGLNEHVQYKSPVLSCGDIRVPVRGRGLPKRLR